VDLTTAYPIDELIVRLGRLGMTVDASDEKAIAALKIDLEDAFDFVVSNCHNEFTDATGAITIPGAVKKAIALLIKIDSGKGGAKLGIKSQSIAGMSKSFAADDQRYDAVYKWLKPYRRIGFVSLGGRRRDHRIR
jgi:hypothetical protein